MDDIDPCAITGHYYAGLEDENGRPLCIVCGAPDDAPREIPTPGQQDESGAVDDAALRSVACTVRGVVLPALVKGGLPDVFDVLVDDFDAESLDNETLVARRAAMEAATETLISKGYAARRFREGCRTVFRFYRQTNGRKERIEP